MARRNNKNNKKKNSTNLQKQQHFIAQNVDSQQLPKTQEEVVTPAVQEVPITKEDLVASANQNDFEKNKETLIQQVLDDIQRWEKERDAAKEAAEQAKKDLEVFKSKLEELGGNKTELQGQYDQLIKDKKAVESEIEEIKKGKERLKQEADSVLDNAKNSAQDIIDEANKERFEIIKKASDESKAAWQKQIDALMSQISDIASREANLETEKLKVDRDKRKIEDDKESLQEQMEDLQARKNKYDKANPIRIAALENELDLEKKKYDGLVEQYKNVADHLNKLQIIMDTVKTEFEDPQNGKQIVSMNEIVSTLKDFKEKYEKLVEIYKDYPNYGSIIELKEKAKRADTLERQYEILEQERNNYRDEVVAARNTKKELEVIKQEVEATNALNEHLLQELESHKTALESRTGDTCPALSKVDTETMDQDFLADISNRTNRKSIYSLKELVTHVKNYAGSRRDEEQLYYTENDIRAFLAGMAVSRLLILQGMSGTGKSSLPRIFSEAISGFNKLIPVESSWRDRNELLGYYNDFNKKFNAKSFTIELYRSSKDCCQEIPTFMVLDEMNLARIEYYFSDFLAILQEPNHEDWLIELVSSDMRTLPMELPDNVKAKMRVDSPSIYSIWEKIERSRQGDLMAEASDEDKELLTSYLERLGQLTGAKSLIDGRKIKVTDNIWFVGTANRDESTFEISDKVYDRAQIVSLNQKGKPEGVYKDPGKIFISVSNLEDLFTEAKRNNKSRKDVENRLIDLDNVLIDKFDVSFGNRIVTQTIDFVAVFIAAGGKLEDALDYQISTKIIRKVISSDDGEALLDLEKLTKDYKETQRLIKKRIKELS